MSINVPVDDALKQAAADAAPGDHLQTASSVYVYEAPVRLWHWLNAACITILALTGYFIGEPLPSVPGEASNNYVMGYIRFAHFAAGYVLAVAFVGRIYWAFVGNHHARQLFTVPLHKKEWWVGVIHEIKWYAFIAKEPKKYVGHNPLAQLAMFFMFTLSILAMIVTGFALYSEHAGPGHWSTSAFGWVRGIVQNSQDLHTIHHLGMWFLCAFIFVHVYAAIREDIMSRQSLISTMISGWRMFKDDRP